MMKVLKEHFPNKHIIPCRNARVNLDQVLEKKTFDLYNYSHILDYDHEKQSGGGGAGGFVLAKSLQTTNSVSCKIDPAEDLDVIEVRSFFSNLYMKYSKYVILRSKAVVIMGDPAVKSRRHMEVFQGVGGHVDNDVVPMRSDVTTSHVVVIFQYAVTMDIVREIQQAFMNCTLTKADEKRNGKTPAEKMLSMANYI